MWKLIAIGLLISGCASTVPTPPPNLNKKVSPVEKDVETVSNLDRTITFFKELEEEEKIVKDKTIKEKVVEINKFFNNRFAYQKDEVTYEMDDYWASIYEMIQAGFVGDCEDYTFAKIQLAELFGIEKDNIYIGYTEAGKHIFPMFNDNGNILITDTNGNVKNIDNYIKLYPDMQVYTINDIWKTNDKVFSSRRGGAMLNKMVGVGAKAKQ